LINEVYGEFFTDNFPARACVEVARLPRDANFEVEAVGLL
jgi:2-iminobutanoate/2-iminopropanoate deaminase